MIVEDIWEINTYTVVLFFPGHQEPGYEANEWTAELVPFLIFFIYSSHRTI